MASSTSDVLAMADDALVASQRLSEWIARAPTIEEDVAIGNIALDLLGQARLLLGLVGDEDELAYFRDLRDFRNVLLVERPLPDFAVLVVRHLLLAAHQHELYDGLRGDPVLGGIAGKAVKEVAYHRDHWRLWTLRLGDGTDESRRRMVAALDEEWRFWPELEAAPAADQWVRGVLAEATLEVPDVPPVRGGGRDGVHQDSFGHLLAGMQHLARSHPGASW